MTSDVKSRKQLFLCLPHVLSLVYRKSRSQEDTTVDHADVRGLAPTLRASVGCLPLSRELFETQLEGPTDLGRIPVGPGTFNQGTPGMGMPSLVNTALLTPRPTGICRGR
jgi:hypothetical protein